MARFDGLDFYNLDSLTSLSGLESITDVEGLNIVENDSLCQSVVFHG